MYHHSISQDQLSEFKGLWNSKCKGNENQFPYKIWAQKSSFSWVSPERTAGNPRATNLSVTAHLPEKTWPNLGPRKKTTPALPRRWSSEVSVLFRGLFAQCDLHGTAASVCGLVGGRVLLLLSSGRLVIVFITADAAAGVRGTALSVATPTWTLQGGVSRQNHNMDTVRKPSHSYRTTPTDMPKPEHDTWRNPTDAVNKTRIMPRLLSMTL